MGCAALVLELPGPADRDLARNRRRNPRRHGRVEGAPAKSPPPQAAPRPLLNSPESRVGLGGAAVRDALQRQLGDRRHGRPTPPRAVVAKTGSVRHPPQSARRPDADPALPAISLLLVVKAIPKHSVHPRRG